MKKLFLLLTILFSATLFAQTTVTTKHDKVRIKTTPASAGTDNILAIDGSGNIVKTSTTADDIASGVAGLDTEVQFNDGGIMGTDSDFTYDGTALWLNSGKKIRLGTDNATPLKHPTIWGDDFFFGDSKLYFDAGENFGMQAYFRPNGTGTFSYLNVWNAETEGLAGKLTLGVSQTTAFMHVFTDAGHTNIIDNLVIGEGSTNNQLQSIDFLFDNVEEINFDKDGNINANSFVKKGGTSSQVLMADGSVTALSTPVAYTWQWNQFASGGTSLAGSFALDNVTFASATLLSVGEQSNQGDTTLEYWNTLSVGDVITFSDKDNPENIMVLKVTGAVVDNTTYVNIPIEPISTSYTLVHSQQHTPTFNYTSQAGGGTGLEAINEGNGIGYRIVGRDVARYGNIGSNAVDFSFSSGASSVRGSTGDYSATFGDDTVNNESYSFATGYANNLNSDGTGALYNVVHGIENLTYNGSQANIVSGEKNTVGISGQSMSGTPRTWYGITSGISNDSYAGAGSHLLGANLVNGAGGSTVIGVSNIDVTQTVATQTQHTWFGNDLSKGNNALFVIGNGAYNTASETEVRSNSLVAWHSGAIEAPSLTPALITSTGNTSLITKEYGDANYAGGFDGFNETGTDAGNDLITTMGDPNSTNQVHLVVDEVAGNMKFGYNQFGSLGYTWNNSGRMSWGSVSNSGGVFNQAGSHNLSIILASTSETVTTKADYSLNVGRGNIIDTQGFYGAVIGSFNTIEATGASSSFTAGTENELFGQASIGLGRGTITQSFGEVAVGSYNTDYVRAGGATTWDIADRVFNIGNGQNTGSRSDALTVFKSGAITAPSLTPALITSTGNASLITKEYGDANYGGDVTKVGTPVATEAGFWTGDGTLKSESNFKYNGTLFDFTDQVRITDASGLQVDIGGSDWAMLKHNRLEIYNDGAESSLWADYDRLTFEDSANGGSQVILSQTTATDYTQTLPLKTGTFAMLSDLEKLTGYTVAGLPAGTEGDTAYVTDATTPTYLGTLTGGGAIKCPVFHNGTAWVSH